MILTAKSPEETIRIGERIASRAKKGDIIGFTGELGSGKTTMIKGIVKYLTGKEATSPSFVLINEYPGKIPVFHFDLYRLRGKIDMKSTGWEEYLDKGLVLIEWADRIRDVLPVRTVFVNISIIDGKRKIEISGQRKAKSLAPHNRVTPCSPPPLRGEAGTQNECGGGEKIQILNSSL